MDQVIQNVRTGQTVTTAVPSPTATETGFIVRIHASVISAGTERYVVELARKSIMGKALERPADVRRILQKVRQDGLRSTISQVEAKLGEPMPLGYSAAGVITECGLASNGFAPGDRVAAVAPHGEMAAVGPNLCARVPSDVTFEDAAYTPIAAIGLQGVRLAKLSLGESVLVIGLGLIGQLCVAMVKAHGCRVFGVDIDPRRLALAREMGADAVATAATPEDAREFTSGTGFDAALLTVATSSNDPIEFAAEACRTKGRIVLVGVTGLQIPRAPFFKKELEFTVSSSMGPGRSDSTYEEKGIDYPIGHVRWTMQRNMQAALQLISEGKLPVQKLTTHRFPIARAPEAYDMIVAKREPFLGIVLDYPPIPSDHARRLAVNPLPTKPLTGRHLGVSLVGAGNFARLVILPALAKIGGVHWRGVCAAHGMGAQTVATQSGFAFATTDSTDIYTDAATQALFIATRHNLHAPMVLAALRSGKNVFVEKPLCIKENELAQISECIRQLGDQCPIIMVGFNRRFAPATQRLREFFAGVAPLAISHRFAVPTLPPNHWAQDVEISGGRIIGEACHAIDTCAAIAGSPPIRVFAESTAKHGGTETPDERVFLTVRHRNGSISSVSYQAGGATGFPAEHIEVFGGGRSATIDAWDKGELWSGTKKTKFAGGRDKGHQQGFAAFCEACRRGGEWPVPWEQIEAVTWASLAAVRSLREGIPISR